MNVLVMLVNSKLWGSFINTRYVSGNLQLFVGNVVGFCHGYMLVTNNNGHQSADCNLHIRVYAKLRGTFPSEI